MTSQEIYDLYVLQSKNVRRLKQVQDCLRKDVNFYLRKGDNFQVEIKTKLSALLYCTLSEAQFIQIAHTPNGFLYSEIEKIKEAKRCSLEEGWKIMIDIAIAKVGDCNTNTDLMNKRSFIYESIKDFIVEPSLLRNKIAHGQWEFALNRENTKENLDVTSQLNTLSIVEVTKWFQVHQFLTLIIRDLIQSPRVGFHNNYWANFTSLKEYLATTENWTLDTKRNLLSKKKINKK